jgi:nucleoside-diphosphate-sugar epimerase
MSENDRRYAGKRVLITGGSGFLGVHLTRALLAEGASVAVLARRGGSADPLPDSSAVLARQQRKPAAPLVFINGDVRDEAAVCAAIESRFDYVFHLAAYSGQVPGYADHHESLTTNCLGLLNVLDAMRRFTPETALCFPSSRLVYGRAQRLPVREELAPSPLSLYGVHKRTGEEYCAYYGARWGVRTVVLRLSNPYGPHQSAQHNRYNVANWMLDEIAGGGAVRIFGRGEQLRDYVYVDDAVGAMLASAAAARAHGRVYNVGSGEGVALVDFVRDAIGVAGRGAMLFEPWPDEYLKVETGDYVGDISRIRDELGWTPRVGLREGIARTMAVHTRSRGQLAATAARRAARGKPAGAAPSGGTDEPVIAEQREAA